MKHYKNVWEYKMFLNALYRNFYEIKVLTLSFHRINVYESCNVCYSAKKSSTTSEIFYCIIQMRKDY